MTNATRIEDAVNRFLSVVRRPARGSEAELAELLDSLDELSLVARSVEHVFEEGHPDPPDPNYRENLAQARWRFPGLPPYNIPDLVSVSPGEAQVLVGDPYDDIADLRGDLEQVAWCFQHTSANDALWHFQHGYQSHWGYHLANLRWFLFHHEFEPPAA